MLDETYGIGFCSDQAPRLGSDPVPRLAPKGQAFSQPRATPWGFGTPSERLRRPNGPTVPLIPDIALVDLDFVFCTEKREIRPEM